MEPLGSLPLVEALHISAHVDACARGFISLATALTNASHFAAQASPEMVNDEFDRFKIWAGNIAAHRKGRRSLEYRLRDAAHLKIETHNLLKALQDSLADALAVVSGERTPWDEMSASDSGSESGSETSGDAGDFDFQSDTELKQLCASIKNTVTCLFRLSMAIRDPAPNTQSRSFITVDKSYFEHHDIQHVESKFPQAEKYLTERLGRAISGRRQYLSYREEHHQKLVKNIERIGHEEPRTEHTTNSTEVSPMPILDQAKVNTVTDDSFDFDTLSQTSYATSINATIRAPPLPKEAKEKEHFECPLCYMIVSIHTTAGWKQHVYRDLHPFCCTYKRCTTADRLYDSRRSWFMHELAHRSTWQCIEGCNNAFHLENDFITHVQAQHPELSAPSIMSALRQTAAKSANLSDLTQCPLCKKKMTLRALQKHLGHHQEQLSLFALPPNLDETEVDNEDEDLVDVERWKDDESSDISDTADVSDDPGSDNNLEVTLENTFDNDLNATNEQLKQIEEVGKIAITQRMLNDPLIPKFLEIRQQLQEDVDSWPAERHQQLKDQNIDPLIFAYQRYAESQKNRMEDLNDLIASTNEKSGTGKESKKLPRVPWGATPETPLGRIAGIALHFHTDLVPPAMSFMKKTPAGESTRILLSDRINREVVLELDAIDTGGNEEVRTRREALMKEVNDLLFDMNQVSTKSFCQHPGCGQSFSLTIDLQRHQAREHPFISSSEESDTDQSVGRLEQVSENEDPIREQSQNMRERPHPSIHKNLQIAQDEAQIRAKEDEKQIRFELGRGNQRAEARLAESERRRAEERQETRLRKQREQAKAVAAKEEKRAIDNRLAADIARREKAIRDDQAELTGRESRPRDSQLLTRDMSNTTRHRSRRPSISRAQSQERDLLLAETEAQRAREAAEQREREAYAPLLRQQEQTSQYWDPRGGARNPVTVESPRLSGRRGSVSGRRPSISSSGQPPSMSIGRTGLQRRASIVHQGPPASLPQTNTSFANQYSTRPPSARMNQATPLFSPAGSSQTYIDSGPPTYIGSRPPSARHASYNDNPFAVPPTRTSQENPFAPTPGVVQQVHTMDPWDTRNFPEAKTLPPKYDPSSTFRPHSPGLVRVENAILQGDVLTPYGYERPISPPDFLASPVLGPDSGVHGSGVSILNVTPQKSPSPFSSPSIAALNVRKHNETEVQPLANEQNQGPMEPEKGSRDLGSPTDQDRLDGLLTGSMKLPTLFVSPGAAGTGKSIVLNALKNVLEPTRTRDGDAEQLGQDMNSAKLQGTTVDETRTLEQVIPKISKSRWRKMREMSLMNSIGNHASDLDLLHIPDPPPQAEVSVRCYPDFPHAELYTCQDCQEEFEEKVDLVEHKKTHNRPWKCPHDWCNYYELGWPTEKERDRHIDEQHTSSSPYYTCLNIECVYRCNSMSALKQHMEETHGHEYNESAMRQRTHIADKASIPTTADTAQRSLVPASVEEYDVDEGFDEDREEMTRQAWFSLRASRELKEEQRLESLRRNAEEREKSIEDLTLADEPRANEWFVPGDGRTREAVTAAFQRDTGTDVLAIPGAGTGAYDGVSGYWITPLQTENSTDVAEQRGNAQKYTVEVREPSVRDLREHRLSGYYSESPAFQQHPIHSIHNTDNAENTAEKAIYRIVEMGFTPEQARQALKQTDQGDGLSVDRAIELLLRSM